MVAPRQDKMRQYFLLLKQSAAIPWTSWMLSVSCPYLRELVGRSWYHRVDSPAYDVGSAFVDYLLRKYAMERLLRLYFSRRPLRVHGSMATSVQKRIDPQKSFSDASVDHTDARKAIVRCFGRSDDARR